MKRWLGRLTVICVLALVGYGAWSHRHHIVNALAARSAPIAEQPLPMYAEVREAQHVVEVSGPLADYMSRKKPAEGETAEPVETQATIAKVVASPGPTVAPVSLRDTASGPAAESPVGTSSAILQQTFRVAGVVNLPFEVPARAANPQLKGSYRSSGAQGADADVEFLVLNERQYGDFLDGRGGEAVFSADDAHAQELNVSLPPTFDQPAKYYLVFRDNARTPGKKVVKAEFRIDF